MIHEIIKLRDYYPIDSCATLECFSPYTTDAKQSVKPGILICPGGGYEFVSLREGDAIALSFMLKGYNCFVLTYTVCKGTSKKPLYPLPILESLAAIDFLKNNCKKYYLDKEKIYMMGFSAGAHLAGICGYLYRDNNLLSSLGLSLKDNLRPFGLCLAYPVISTTKHTHAASVTNLTNDDPNLVDLLSIENHVCGDYPPTFIWTLENDTIVPNLNTKMMDKSLCKYNVKHETIIYKEGFHGISNALSLVNDKDYPGVMDWVDLCDKFFKSI